MLWEAFVVVFNLFLSAPHWISLCFFSRCIANNAVAKKQRRSPEAALRVSQFSGTYRPPQFLMWPPATNETVSAAATSHTTSLLLSSHPSLSEMQFVEVVVQQGHDLVLECAASGWPVPKLMWSRSPSLIPGIKGMWWSPDRTSKTLAQAYVLQHLAD